jgi:hypothetical protein
LSEEYLEYHRLAVTAITFKLNQAAMWFAAEKARSCEALSNDAESAGVVCRWVAAASE